MLHVGLSEQQQAAVQAFLRQARACYMSDTAAHHAELGSSMIPDAGLAAQQ